MIHYTCDLCERRLNSQRDVRYVVKIDVSPAFEPLAVDEAEDDRENLYEINELLEQLQEADGPLADDAPATIQFDLCAECKKKFLKDPLSRDALKQFDFSKN